MVSPSNNLDVEYIRGVCDNLRFVGEEMLKDTHPEHWRYYIEHEAIPAALGIVAAINKCYTE